jgi:5-formyltetrahydrofolate cyclo-ligase
VRELLSWWLTSNRRLAAVRADWSGRTLEPAWVEDLDAGWCTGPMGIRQPAPEAPHAERADIDLVLVPGVAFDAACRRLGRGGGFYDRLLALEDWPAPRVALAFEVQLTEQLPEEEHDRPVDAVVTEERVLIRAGGRLADDPPPP